MGKNYFSVSGTYGGGPAAINVDFSDYTVESVIETNNHIFDTSIAFPELNEYSKVDSYNSNLGLNKDMLSFSQEAIATIKMVQSAGSFKNVLGYYAVDHDGTIRDVSIAFSNTRATESGLTHSFDIGNNGGSVNFFIIANGYNLNSFLADKNIEEGNLNFVYHHGQDDERLAKVTDSAEDITLIYQAGNGEISTVKGPVYHATDTVDGSHINSDGDVHVVSGIAGNGDSEVLRIGFEDFPGLGDADFNDIVFDVSASYLNPTGDAGIQVLTNLEPAASGDQDSSEDQSNQSQGGIGSQAGIWDGENGIDGLDGGQGIGGGTGAGVVVSGDNDPIDIDDVLGGNDHIDESIAAFIGMGENSETTIDTSIASVSQPVAGVVEIPTQESQDFVIDTSSIV